MKSGWESNRYTPVKDSRSGRRAVGVHELHCRSKRDTSTEETGARVWVTCVSLDRGCFDEVLRDLWVCADSLDVVVCGGSGEEE